MTFMPIVWIAIWIPFLLLVHLSSVDTVGLKQTLHGEVNSYFTGGQGALGKMMRNDAGRFIRLVNWMLEGNKQKRSKPAEPDAPGE